MPNLSIIIYSTRSDKQKMRVLHLGLKFGVKTANKMKREDDNYEKANPTPILSNLTLMNRGVLVKWFGFTNPGSLKNIIKTCF